MNITTRTARADQFHATVRDARDCDALTPCASCQGMTAEVRATRKAARVAAHRAAAVVKVPSFDMLRSRLARVSA